MISAVGTIPGPLLLRTYDLFFLNTIEHLVPILPAQLIHNLLIPMCTPYLSSSRDPNLHAQFEAAHSVMLAIIAAAPPAATISKNNSITTNTADTSNVLPLYADMIFKSFPGGLSRRQFRLAFSTLVKVCEVPPGGLDADKGRVPGGGEAVMQIGFERAKAAEEIALLEAAGDGGVSPVAAAAAVAANSAASASAVAAPANPSAAVTTTRPTSSSLPVTAGGAAVVPPPPPPPPYTEKEIYVLALIDSLPHLLPAALERWLTPVAELMSKDVKDAASRGRLKRRFWEVLSGGELDLERAEVGVRWWSEGGKGIVEWEAGGHDAGKGGEEEGGQGNEKEVKMLEEGKSEKDDAEKGEKVRGGLGTAAAGAKQGRKRRGENGAVVLAKL